MDRNSNLSFGAIRFFSVNETLTQITIAVAQILFLFALSTLLLAITYKLIPDAKVHWRDSILGAVIAGVAFTVTNYIIGTYVETFTVTTIIGAAGSLMIILLWIFILNQICYSAPRFRRFTLQLLRTHSREHLPPTAEKIVKPLEIAGERIEQATKGNLLKPTEKPVEKPQAQEAAEKTEIQTPKKEEKTEEKTIETEQFNDGAKCRSSGT